MVQMTERSPGRIRVLPQPQSARGLRLIESSLSMSCSPAHSNKEQLADVMLRLHFTVYVTREAHYMYTL